MKRTLAGIVAVGLAGGLGASCASLSGLSGAGGTDGGHTDATTTCGGAGDPCCNASACDPGLICGGAVCLHCGEAGEPCCNAGTCNNGLMCDGVSCAGGSGPGSGSGSSRGSGSGSGSGTSFGTGTGRADAGSTSGTGSSSGSGSCAGDSGALPPSCASGGAGMTNCGACQESCCASQEVPGGPFYRTYSNAGSGATGEADPATVSNFRLDKYLVTVGRFRQFVTAWNNGSGWKPGASAGKHAYLNGGSGLVNAGSGGGYESGWLASDDANVSPTDANLACGTDGWTNTPAGQETLPIGCVNWWEAYAFCIWDGGFLPSEAEVAYAEAGGADQREYPWGSASPGTASQYAIFGCDYGTGACPATLANIAPVGTAALGSARWGHLDLTGDVLEWDLDWASGYTACTDCAYLSAETQRVVRGTNYGFPATTLVSTYRYYYSPSSRFGGVGFRCGRAP